MEKAQVFYLKYASYLLFKNNYNVFVNNIHYFDKIISKDKIYLYNLNSK
jgi:hypothetical protein